MIRSFRLALLPLSVLSLSLSLLPPRTGAGDPPATDPPATDPPAGDPPAPNPGGNEEGKYRRLHEKSENDKKTMQAELDALKAADKQRKDAELSDAQREKNRADDAEKRANALEHEKLVNKVAGEHKLSDEARELLTGDDEATLIANAAKLAAIMKTPAKAGTQTQPPGTPAPTLDEQIEAAEKAGNRNLSLTLKLQKMRASG